MQLQSFGFSLRAAVRLAVSLPLLAAWSFLAIAADPPAAAGTDKDGWKKLFDGKTLTGWTASDFGGGGKVQVSDGTIRMEMGDSMTGITYAGKDFPRMDYEVTLEAKRAEGDDFFCTTTFPVGEDYCSFVVGGWGGSIVGLSSVGYEDASSNETTKTKDFDKDKWYRIRLRVSKGKIEAWIADEKMVDLDTTDVKLSIRIECRPSEPFGIATWKTTGVVKDIRLRMLTDADKKALGEKKASGNK